MSHTSISCPHCEMTVRIPSEQLSGYVINDVRVPVKHQKVWLKWICPICNKSMLSKNAKRHVQKTKLHPINQIVAQNIPADVEKGVIQPKTMIEKFPKVINVDKRIRGRPRKGDIIVKKVIEKVVKPKKEKKVKVDVDVKKDVAKSVQIVEKEIEAIKDELVEPPKKPKSVIRLTDVVKSRRKQIE